MARTYIPKEIQAPNLNSGLNAIIASNNSAARSANDFVDAFGKTRENIELKASENYKRMAESNTADFISQIRNGKSPELTGLYNGQQVTDADFEYDKYKKVEARAATAEARAVAEEARKKGIYDKRINTDYYTTHGRGNKDSGSGIDFGAYLKSLQTNPTAENPIEDAPLVKEDETALNNVLGGQKVVPDANGSPVVVPTDNSAFASVVGSDNAVVNPDSVETLTKLANAGTPQFEPKVPENYAASGGGAGAVPLTPKPAATTAVQPQKKPLTKAEKRSEDILSGVINREDYQKDVNNVLKDGNVAGKSGLNYDATMNVIGSAMKQHAENYKSAYIRKEKIVDEIATLDQEIYRIEGTPPPAGANSSDLKQIKFIKDTVTAKYKAQRARLVKEDTKLNSGIKSEQSNIQKTQDGIIGKAFDGINATALDPKTSRTTKLAALSTSFERLSKIPGLTDKSVEKINSMRDKIVDTIGKVSKQAGSTPSKDADTVHRGSTVNTESAVSGDVAQLVTKEGKFKIARAFDLYTNYAADNNIEMPSKKSWDQALRSLTTNKGLLSAIKGDTEIIDSNDQGWFFGMGEPTAEVEVTPQELFDELKPILKGYGGLKTKSAKGRSEQQKTANRESLLMAIERNNDRNRKK